MYRLAKRYCPHCRRNITARAPGALPKSLFSNKLLADALAIHYVHGVAIGRMSEYLHVRASSLAQVFRWCADLFENIPGRLVREYRQAPVKHADETGWRTDGKNGYVWLCATPNPSIFRFGKDRSSQVPQAVLGKDPLPGILVVDRYAVYNKAPCQIQYEFAHLLRDVEDLEKQFPGEKGVASFAGVVARQVALAMGLLGHRISDEELYRRAQALREEIEATMTQPARHPAIRRIQDMFRENGCRLLHWADNKAVPADNTLAEQTLLPSVIARKVRFGSVTHAGARMRSTLSTVAVRIHKRGEDVGGRIKAALDLLGLNPKADPFQVLLPASNPPRSDH